MKVASSKYKYKFKPQEHFQTIAEHIDLKTVIKTVFWGLLVVAMILFLVLFMHDRSAGLDRTYDAPFIVTEEGEQAFTYYTVGQIRSAIRTGEIYSVEWLTKAYSQMNNWASFPVIDFSLMLWHKNLMIPSLTPYEVWSIRWTNISKAYTYMFITAVFAAAALCLLIYINFYKYHENKRAKKYGLSVKYSTTKISFNSYSIKTITDFVISFATVFAFFNFVSTLIIIGYWFILFLILFIYKWIDHRYKIKQVQQIHLLSSGIRGLIPEAKTMWYLIGIMIFQNTYTILQHFFINIYGVNLDIVISTILPIGTLTVILVIFIRQLFDSRLGWMTKYMKTINDQTNDFRIYIVHSGKTSMEDYDFIRNIPLFIKKELSNEVITTTEAYAMLQEISEMCYKIKTEFAGKKKLRNYLLYVLFYIIRFRDEMDEFYYNLNRVIIHTKRYNDRLNEATARAEIEQAVI